MIKDLDLRSLPGNPNTVLTISGRYGICLLNTKQRPPSREDPPKVHFCPIFSKKYKDNRHKLDKEELDFHSKYRFD